MFVFGVWLEVITSPIANFQVVKETFIDSRAIESNRSCLPLRTIIIRQQIQLLKLPPTICPLISSCAVLFVFRLIFFLQTQHFFFCFIKHPGMFNDEPQSLYSFNIPQSYNCCLLLPTSHVHCTLNKSIFDIYNTVFHKSCKVSCILLQCTIIQINLGDSSGMVKWVNNFTHDIIFITHRLLVLRRLF